MPGADKVVIAPGKSGAPAGHARRPDVRFTSNIVGPIYLLVDLICLVVSAPVALFAYDTIIGDRVILSVHAFAFAILTAASQTPDGPTQSPEPAGPTVRTSATYRNSSRTGKTSSTGVRLRTGSTNSRSSPR